MFEYSDSRANYPTHGMLTLSKTYAVKTGQPHHCCKPQASRFRQATKQLTKLLKYLQNGSLVLGSLALACLGLVCLGLTCLALAPWVFLLGASSLALPPWGFLLVACAT
jgi:hypothetical protein